MARPVLVYTGPFVQVEEGERDGKRFTMVHFPGGEITVSYYEGDAIRIECDVTNWKLELTDDFQLLVDESVLIP